MIGKHFYFVYENHGRVPRRFSCGVVHAKPHKFHRAGSVSLFFMHCGIVEYFSGTRGDLRRLAEKKAKGRGDIKFFNLNDEFFHML